MARLSSLLLALLACGVAGMPRALAQDFEPTGLEGPDLKKKSPTIEEIEGSKNEVTELPEKKVAVDNYLIVCGQACAFETEKEAMALAMIYFQDMKSSTVDVTSERYKKNVLECTSHPEACENDPKKQQMLMESALHYNLGKFLRNAYLENETNSYNMMSLGHDRFKTADESRNEVESLDYKWYRGESTWTAIDAVRPYMRIRENETRDHFQFDLDAVEAAEKKTRSSDEAKLAQLDPEFASQYRAFFHSYVPHNDQFFAQEQKISRKGREIASESSPDYAFNPKPDGRGIVLDDKIKNEVNGGMANASGVLDKARQIALQTGHTKDGEGFTQAPLIFQSDDTYFAERARRLNFAKDLLDGKITTNKETAAPPTNMTKLSEITDENARKQLEQNLEALGVDSDVVGRGDKAEIRAELDKLSKKNDENDKKGHPARQIAEELNRKMLAVVDQQKRNDPGDSESRLSISYDTTDFDKFLNQIWPTDEGEKRRVAEEKEKHTTTSIGRPTD